MHKKKKNCESSQVISKITRMLQNANESHQLYPNELLVSAAAIQGPPLIKANGGWSDERDHNLCLDFTSLE